MSNFYFNLEDICIIITGFPRSSFGKESAFNAGDPVQFLGLEELLEKGWATHSSILGLPLWLSCERIRLQRGGSGFDSWVGKIPWRRAWQPTPVFLPGESPWTEDPAGLQSMGSQKSWTRLSDFHFI